MIELCDKEYEEIRVAVATCKRKKKNIYINKLMILIILYLFYYLNFGIELRHFIYNVSKIDSEMGDIQIPNVTLYCLI